LIIGYLIHFIRSFLIILANLIKRRIKAPDYVQFTLHGSYPDLKEPPKGFLQSKIQPREKSLQELEKEFQLIAKSQQVKGIILHLGNLNLPFSRIQSLTRMIENLQDSGKEVITWAKNYDTRSYFLATAADRIMLQEGGVVYTLGFANRQLYMKNALDWCGIEFDVVKVSPYKSALEMFTRSNMSEEVREMINWLMDSIYEQFVGAVGRGRNLKEEEVKALMDKTPLYGEKAVQEKAIDKVINAEDLPGFLGSQEKAARVATWDECGKIFPRPLPPFPGRYIAVLRVQGNIVDGKSQRPPAPPPFPIPFLFNEQTGDLSFVQQARQALRDKRIKGVLLYIDSGGGSAAASEAITSALQKIAAKKPVVAMLGSIAGSGGYYVATPASHVVAQPATITGSIGVITARLVNSRLLEKLLLNRESIERGQKDLFESTDAPFTEEEREKVWEFVNQIYELFLKRVAESRNKNAQEVDEVGRGKVWTGEQALSHGLVDELGGLQAALSKLRSLADLPPNTGLVEIPLPKQDSSPVPVAGGMVKYALDNLSHLQKEQAMMAGPLYFHNPLEPGSTNGNSS